MYSLDVNFLKDRNLDLSKMTTVDPIASGPSLKQQLPIYIGAGVMLALLSLSGLSILFISWQKDQTQQNIQVLEGEIAKLNSQNQKIQQIEGQIKTLNEEITGLVGVFNQVKPWSAILQDLTDQTPATVQISSIQQADKALTLSGFARDYGDLNDFVLTLQNSRFFNADKTKLVTATTEALPLKAEGATTDKGDGATPPPAQGEKGDKSAGPTVTIPPGVKYTITTELTDTPDQELIDELRRKTAIGLPARFKIMEQKGILSSVPSPPPAPILQSGGQPSANPANPQASPVSTQGANNP